tara:strand:- start:51 stop:1595 length:1545 start_codon:yes stop_codon:yes gene_type:complete
MESKSPSGIDSCDGSQLFSEAMNHFSEIVEEKLRNSKITSMKQKLKKALEGKQILGAENKRFVITSDPMEEFDDIVMIRFVLYQMVGASVTVILSGGHKSPDERLRNVEGIFPEFSGVTMNAPVRGEYGTEITFVPDGEFSVSDGEKYDAFVNCGPSSPETLDNIVLSLKDGATVITVGANDKDSTAAAGINQKFTGTVGEAPETNKEKWNSAITAMRAKGCKIKNLSVGLSRYVLFPNPRKMPGTPYGALAKQKAFFDEAVGTTGMFICSRPPPKFGGRVNFGNSCVDYQLCRDLLQNASENAGFEEGIKNIEAYCRYSKNESQGGDPTFLAAYGRAEDVEEKPPAVLAAIPLMCTALLGGVRKKGEEGRVWKYSAQSGSFQLPEHIKPPIFGGNEGYFFGSAPDDTDSKMNHAWVEGGVDGPFGEAVKNLPFFTPAYDPLAVLMAIDVMMDDGAEEYLEKTSAARNTKFARRGGRRRKRRKKTKKKKRKSKKGGKRKRRKTKRKHKKTKKRR